MKLIKWFIQKWKGKPKESKPYVNPRIVFGAPDLTPEEEEAFRANMWWDR